MRAFLVAALLGTVLLAGCTVSHGAAAVTCEQYKDYLIASIDFPQQGALDTTAFSHLTATDQASITNARDAFRRQWFGIPTTQVTGPPSLCQMGFCGTVPGTPGASPQEQQALLANWTTWASMAEQDIMARRGC